MMLDKREKMAWRFSIIAIAFLALNNLTNIFSQKYLHFCFSLISHLFLLGIFYMAFKKRRPMFSALGFSIFLPGHIQAIDTIRHLAKDGFTPVLAGAAVAEVFFLLATYFVLMAFLSQMYHRRSRST